MTGTANVGGLAGYSLYTAKIDNSYPTGSVAAVTTHAGGVSGVTETPTVSMCYSACTVTGTLPDTGGLIGSGGTSTVSSYYDSDRDLPRTTAEMLLQSNYTGWDFTGIWTTSGGSYPYLRWQGSAHIPVPQGTISQEEGLSPRVDYRPLRGIHRFFIDISVIPGYATCKEIAMDLTKIHGMDIVILCGIYGAGKMEFARKYFLGRERSRISRSDIRRAMYEMANFGEHWTPERFSEENDSLVKHIERKTVEHFLHFKKNVLVINTFATKKSRRGIIEMARQMKRSIGAIFLNRPLDQCIARNAESSLPVPQEVVYALHHRVELPDKSEGFDEILLVNFK